MNFEELIARINPKMKGIIYRLRCPVAFVNEDDMYQEAVFHLWEENQAGMLEDKTDSFILQNVYYFLKNYLRKCTKKIESLLVYFHETTETKGSSLEEVLLSDKASRSFRDIELRLIIEDMCRHLTEREQVVIALIQEGLTTRQIGERLGVSHVMVIKIEHAIREKCKFVECELV